MRSVVDLNLISQRTFWIDCDVIRADGGTRTAAITGSFICLADAFHFAMQKGLIAKNPIKAYLAAISVGMVRKQPMLDLCYEEDSTAEVDMNIVMTGSGDMVEIQGTAEGTPFSVQNLDELIKLAKDGIDGLISLQKDIVRDFSPLINIS